MTTENACFCGVGLLILINILAIVLLLKKTQYVPGNVTYDGTDSKRTVPFSRIWLAYILAFTLLGLSSCGQKETVSTWQEQYDLGVRYLSEYNYEEAIIAFTAAIEIDPKQSEAYQGAAEAYRGLGDMDMARSILEQGIVATGDEGLSALLSELADQTESSIEADGVPALPEELLTYFSGWEADYYYPMTAPEALAFMPLIEAGQSGDMDGLISLMQSESIIAAAKEIGKSSWWTQIDGALLRVKGIDEQGNRIRVEYLPQSGTGFYGHISLVEDDICTGYTIGSVNGYLWNGDYTYFRRDSDHQTTTYGTAVNGVTHGETKKIYDYDADGTLTGDIIYQYFDHGHEQFPWTDESGEPASVKRVCSDGDISYYRYGTSTNEIETPTGTHTISN